MAGVDDQQWPPRSPYEAILMSPSGRKKLQQRQHRGSPSPSPVKRRTASGNHLQVPQIAEDEDEDEETIKLQLQALEAKLKLKRLQNKRAKEQVNGTGNGDTLLRAPSVLSTRRNDIPMQTGLYRSKSMGDVQVPLSPERRPTLQHEQKSPGRVLLGIDKGLTAKDVSLRKAPSPRKVMYNADPFVETTNGVARNGSVSSRNTTSRSENSAPLTFNERMAQAKVQEKAEKDRRERLDKLRAERSTGFKVRKEEIAAFQEAAQNAPKTQQNPRKLESAALTREDVLRVANKPIGGLLQRSNTTSSLTSGRLSGTQSSKHSRSGSAASLRRPAQDKNSTKGSVSLSDESRPATPDATLFEGFSKTNLSHRILPHSYMARQVEDKIPATLPMLLKEVKAPDFILPPHLEEKDLVVFATIAAKSEPRWHKQTRHQQSKTNELKTAAEEAAEAAANENGKYIIFTLTDLKWSVELYLFQTAYTRWHKLQPGTAVAILNPQIMPPPKHRTDTNRWSFTLNSSDDTVLEIGTSKDLGWCKAKTKEGKDCSDWVDLRKTEFCDYHVNRSVEGLRRGRMEVQGMSVPWGPGGKGSSRNDYLKSMHRQRGNSNDSSNLPTDGRRFDTQSQSSYFVVSRNASTATLLDADEAGELHGSKEERQRKLFAMQEKERDIARALGRGMKGAGAEYLRTRNGEPNNALRPSTTIEASDIDAARSLGLRSNHATDVMLSPLKRKSSVRVTSGSSTEQRGPKRKKTRFITEKGIREAGRDSLGTVVTNHDDDDDLDIV